jgi:RNA polymerase sigma-70 factor (ECF subfamily)
MPDDMATDRAAFAAFYQAHFDTVLGFVTRRITDAHLAADLTADVFLAALQSTSAYRGDGPPAAWLLGIARRVVASEHRRAATDRAAQQRISGRRLLEPADVEALEERIDAERKAREMFHRVRQLPASQRAVVELVAVDGLSLHDAAAVLGIRPTTARVRWLRARRMLHPALPGVTTTKVEAQL